MRFSCNDGYRLVGYEARRCRDDGLWSWGVDPECISDYSYYGQVSGIGVGIIIPIVIVIALIVLYIVMGRDRHRGDYITGEHGK